LEWLSRVASTSSAAFGSTAPLYAVRRDGSFESDPSICGERSEWDNLYISEVEGL
jgi:hypothetical protein